MSSNRPILPPIPAPPPAGTITCPKCGASNLAGTMFCDTCGTTLVQAAGAALPNATVPAIGIWGSRSSGKTMYLYALHRHILSLPLKDWEMMPANEDALNLLKTAEQIIAQHRFPEPTPRTIPVSYLFKFTHRESKGFDREFMMEVMDWPGEIYEKPTEHYAELMEYFKRCTGLLCLIDPDQNKKDNFISFLANLMHDLRYANHEQETKINKKLAFCLSKIDERQHRPKRSASAQAIKEILGRDLVELIEVFCAPGMVRFDFACSAVGFFPGSNPPRSNAGIDFAGKAIIYDAKNMRPIDLFNPLENWLFAI